MSVSLIELLSPAGTLAIGKDAIDAGADAVYVGAPKFGARSSAGVSLEDIRKLVDYAHIFRVKVYVALNTIVYDNELEEVEKIVWELYRCGVDALIIQDMGILAMQLPPIALHASTQCHNESLPSLQRLQALGFEQAVLARELNVEQTKQICQGLHTLRVETFIHGALCVSYSGRCYISQAFMQRSANRGACAQLCRMPYTLKDATGKVILHNQHLLSLKDLNRSSVLEDLIKAGVQSFKIEGRLKGSNYVKNITAYYRQLIDSIISRYPHSYQRSSIGVHTFKFTPHPHKSFTRGFTSYQLKGNKSKEQLIQPYTPKSIGEALSSVKRRDGNRVVLNYKQDLNNGDGVCFISAQGELQGGKVNKVLAPDTFIYNGETVPQVGALLYRNYDSAFDKEVSRSDSCTRSIPISMHFKADEKGLTLRCQLSDARHVQAEHHESITLEPAKQTPNIVRLEEALRKLGGTHYTADSCSIEMGNLFVPISLIGELKRNCIAKLEAATQEAFKATPHPHNNLSTALQEAKAQYPVPEHLPSPYNVSNRLSAQVYEQLGAKQISVAYEIEKQEEMPLMTTKHCLLRYLDACKMEKPHIPYLEPLYLEHGGIRVRLSFDCKACVMKLYATK